MPYISTVKDLACRIETGEAAQQREVVVDDTSYKIDWRFISPLAADSKGNIGIGGRYSLIIDGTSYDIFARRVVKPDEESSQTYEIHFGGQRFEVRVEDEREKALAGSARSLHETGEARLRAPMPGLVIGIPLEVGATVTRGQTVIVLEAMKMENDLGSPQAGIIKEVKVSTGQTVNQGDVLVVISGE